MKWESKNLFTAEDAEDGQRYEKTASKGAQFYQRLHFRHLFAIIKAVDIRGKAALRVLGCPALPPKAWRVRHPCNARVGATSSILKTNNLRLIGLR